MSTNVIFLKSVFTTLVTYDKFVLRMRFKKVIRHELMNGIQDFVTRFRRYQYRTGRQSGGITSQLEPYLLLFMSR